MNWLDIVLIAIVVVVAFMGMKTGLIGAVFTAVGGYVGWLIAGQASDNLGGLFDKSLSSDTLVTVISYAIIVILGLIVGGIIYRIVSPFITVATLGLSSMVDKLGGLALGVVLGLAIAGAVIMAAARLAYNFDIPEAGIAGGVAERIPNVEETRERVEKALTESAIVELFINVTDGIPGDALGFVPSDFRVSLDILEENIE
jgi:uncharacterized membrane protein required for colicin V production